MSRNRGRAVAATVTILLFALLSISNNQTAKFANANTACLGHCHAIRSKKYSEGAVVVRLSGKVERPDPQISTDPAGYSFSTIATWLQTPDNGTYWLEMGIIKGDGITAPCGGCPPYPSTPSFYSYCEGCTSGTGFGNHGAANGTIQFRMKMSVSNVTYNTWLFQDCPNLNCSDSSDTGWVTRRTETISAAIDLRRIKAGGEVLGSSTTAMGVAAILGLHRTLSSQCGGAGQPACDDVWTPNNDTYEEWFKIGNDKVYRSNWIPGPPSILQVSSMCHVLNNC